MMDERLAYPAPTMHWNINGENHDYAATVFQAIVTANGFSVLVEPELPETRQRLRPDSFTGLTILWSEHPHSRSLVMRWQKADGIVLVSQGPETTEVCVAANDIDVARKIIAEIDELLARAPISDLALPITFWHLGNECAEAAARRIELARWNDVKSNYPTKRKLRWGR